MQIVFSFIIGYFGFFLIIVWLNKKFWDEYYKTFPQDLIADDRAQEKYLLNLRKKRQEKIMKKYGKKEQRA